MSEFKVGDLVWGLDTGDEELYGAFEASNIYVKSQVVSDPSQHSLEWGDFHTKRECLEALSRRLYELLKEE